MYIKYDFLRKKYNIKVHGILHVGAHRCEELQDYLKGNVPINKILWIEANPKLVNSIKRSNHKIYILNYLVSDTDDIKENFYISNNGQSSSMLKFGTHTKHHPTIRYINEIKINTSRLDTLYKKNNIKSDFANFLNMDIQGAELMALKGMGNLLNNFDYLYIEVTKEHLYEKCGLVGEIDDYVSKYNFKRVETHWTRHNWGDAFYIKESQKINND